MIIITVPVSNCTPQTIVIGRRGTYETMQIAFDLSYLVQSYGNGVAVLAVKRSQDESAYPAVVTQEDNTLTWTISETDTYYVGSGECQLMWYVDGGLAKTIIYPMVVMRDILATAEEPPDGYENWIEHLTELGAETKQNAQNAAQSATDAETAKDDAVTAKEAAEEAAGMLVNVSATATTLNPGQPATAEYDDGVFRFGIPKGDKLTYADLTEADKEDLVQGQIKDAQDDAVEAVDTAKTNAVNAVNQAGTNQVNAVNGAGATQVQNVNSAGTTQVSNVNQAGTTQVSNVQTEGNTQIQAVADKGAEVLETIPADYTELSNAVFNDVTGLDTKAPVILETASGAIASFSDGADSMPVRKLVAQIEPIQDLHGYDNPWPGGGSKNLFNPQCFLDAGCVLEDGFYKGTNTQVYNAIAIFSRNFIFEENTRYALSYTIKSDDGVYFRLLFKYSNNTSSSAKPFSKTTEQRATVVSTAGENVTSVDRDFSNAGTVWIKDVQLEKSATVTEYIPYSNICPISGHTGAEIEQTGVNVWDEEWDRGYVDTLDGSFNPIPVYVRSKHKFLIDSGKTYYFACSRSGTLGNTGISFYYANGDFISSTVIPVNSAFTAPTKAKMMAFFVPSSWYTGDYANDISINYPSTDTTYHPYTGNQISVTFPSETGTVYGGTLTLNPDRTGTLVVDRVIVDLGTLNWVPEPESASGQFRYVFQGAPIAYYATMHCSQYKCDNAIPYQIVQNGYIVTSNAPSSPMLRIRDERFSSYTGSEAKTALAGVQLVYGLTEPQTYQLTAEQVSGILSTLYGTNNIWANTGDVEVTYPADTKLYIDNKITQAIANALNS